MANQTVYANNVTTDGYSFSYWPSGGQLAKKQYCKLKGTFYCSSSGSYVYINYGTNSKTASYQSSQYIDFEGRLDAGSTFRVYTDNSAGRSRYAQNFTMRASDYKLEKSPVISWAPKDLQPIGNNGYFISFWVKPNGEREFGAVGKKEVSDSAVTWVITPGNYIGYLTIKASNGKVYKVWVYDV